VEKGPDGKPFETVNVVGVLPGTKVEWKGQSALVTAHYDHLGRGWPDAHKGDEGKAHPGADDNASGVAVLLELARALAAGEKPRRTLVFAAFTAEEEGRLGSKFYAAHPGPYPLDKVIGVVNLDTVGRLGTQKLSILGTGTAAEWPHIFRGAGFVTGVESRNIAESAEASDQLSFIEKGVPAVQIFSGPHADYHRPGDTAEKIDGPGLVKVATFVKEAVVYLAERPSPMTVTISAPSSAAAAIPATPGATSATPPGPGGGPAGGQGRRVSFGSVPDFAYQGPGVKVEGLLPGSPAEKAGVKPGDVIRKLDGKEIANLREFSEVLKTLSPGQTVKVTIVRGEKESELTVTVVER
jgi:hypothetical protein